jgi:LysM repeat protein
MSDENVTSFREGHAACPFVAFEDDRDHRSESPDYQHRCFATPEPEPRALPHQERFCLSASFAACPIFLDWARAEAAGVADKSAAATGAGSGTAAPAPSRPQPKTATQTPAFLATGRTTPAESTPRTSHSADPGSGLWGFEGAPRRTVSPAQAPAKVPVPDHSSPAYSMARRGPTRPDWENPPRFDNFPRLRARSDRNNNQPLLLAALAVAAVLVGLIVVPELTSNSGAGPTASVSMLPSGVTPTPEVTPTPTVEPTAAFVVYTVKAGDTLNKIATKYGITVEMIIAANKGTQYEITDQNKILVGQKMFIPPQTWVIPTETPSPTPLPSSTPTLTPTPTASSSTY